MLRSERVAAILLAAAAVAGLVVANTRAFGAVHGLVETSLGGWTVGEWVEDGLLALFFLVVAIELRHEFQHGELRSPARALRPAIAALGGVVLPIAVYLAIVGATGAGDELGGWPIPTATDVAFALGVLALAGGGLLPQRIRAFLLALAIIDDLIGIALIAVLYGADLDRLPTLVAVVLGLALPTRWGHAIRRALEPLVNGVVLPLFAFVASLVVIPADGALQPAFWATAAALPLGKLGGIAGATWLVDRTLTRERGHRMTGLDLATLGALGGIGFTVSLLLASLAFSRDPGLSAQAILGVLVGSAVSLVLSVVLLLARRRRSGASSSGASSSGASSGQNSAPRGP